jgi:hypothetical protein
MFLEAAPLSLLLTPFLLAAVFYVVGGPLFDSKSRVWRLVICGVTAAFLLRYLHWRLFDTVLTADGNPAEIGWIWTVFLAELITYGDAVILFLMFLKPTNRSAGGPRRREARPASTC